MTTGVDFARMDNAPATHSILDTLRTVEFRLGLKGYNVDEVDEYLEKAAVEAEQVQERLRTSNERLRHATERISQLEAELKESSAERTAALQSSAREAQSAAGPATQANAVSDDTLQRTLLLAQKFVDQTKRESETEAAQVVSRAEERARTLLAQAEERARQLTAETEKRMHEEVGRLEETRARLASDVDAMSRHLEEQRTSIRASLTEALRWVDERMQAPTPTTGERGADGGAAAPADDRGPSGEGAGNAARADRGGGGSTAVGPVRPQAGSPAPGAPERQSSSVVTSHPLASAPAPDRTQAPVGAGLGVLNGGLFEAGRDETTASEGNRLDER